MSFRLLLGQVARRTWSWGSTPIRTASTIPSYCAPELSYTSTDAKTPVRLRMVEDTFPFNKEPELVQTMVRRTVQNFPDSPAIAYKGEDGQWVKLTYTQYLDLIETVAKGFIALGLEESHSVAVMSQNCHQWCTSRLMLIQK